ncbi:MAG: D-hexose-6-phosphate mutarotase [Planctomycetota bacterium]|nr:D-hexose-6-phosphate mutarotase [Planctomycetota bacterium]
MGQLLSDLQGLCIANTLSFEEGPNGLLRAAIVTPHAEATVYLHGAHVTHYRPVGQKPLLFMSDKSHFDSAKPMRGGIPICFPWFGPRAGDPSSAIHGFARVQPWTVESTAELPDKSVTITLRLDSTDATLRIWPFSFAARYRVTIGPSLNLSLEVQNTSLKAITFEEALHSYFSVGDVRQLSISGLANTSYLDKTDGMKRKTQDDAPITIAGETDRVYLDARMPCFIDDPTLARRIIIEKTGSDTTVLWNPWIAKAIAMPDFGEDEWTRMLCIESANAGPNAVTVAPDRRHTLAIRYTSEPR